ncbi:MAG: pyridoxal-phosphate-dependent aminotransferase family protein, partial [Oceanidesulfovibrio sp.]
MNTYDFNDLKLFITGPTYIRPEVRHAGSLPEFGHRDSESVKRFGPIFENLAVLAGLPKDSDYRIAIINGSGTCAMETAVRSLAGPEDTILSMPVGAFGDLFHKLAVANGKTTEKVPCEPGRAMDLAALERALDEVKPSLVLLTHNETSTGVMNDVALAVALVREHGALAAVDGVSIFGGAPIDLPGMQPDIYLTSTQKSLGLPAGFGIAFAGPRAMAKAETVPHKGWITDLTAHLGRAAKQQTLTTPNTTLANQLAIQLDYIVNQEGMENRFARHIAMRDRVAEFIAGLDGFELFAPHGYRSPTVT